MRARAGQAFVPLPGSYTACGVGDAMVTIRPIKRTKAMQNLPR
jgi:hypothetical protein